MVEEGRTSHADSGQSAQEGRPVALDEIRKQSVVLKELLEFLAQNLVTHPDAVEVTENQTEEQSTLHLRVDKEDLGRVIGKQGRTAKSLRTILNAAASRANRKVVLEIVED
ncbi:MAG: KH domain-containing protein [Deltaproteobacteria bacterium]|nr:MAG: KH domain-containing protein [Deltaproteobacteria bacterium]